MASICPNCRQELEEDVVCCAELRHNWRCRQCGKRSVGFVVPYGRCYLCGGENEVVEAFAADDAGAVRLVEEAMQFEVDTFHFYSLGQQRTTDEAQKTLFHDLCHLEKEHLDELERKYHVHLEPQVLEMTPDTSQLLSGHIFAGVSFDDPPVGARQLYELALSMERRTRDHFARRAEEMPPGTARDLCREFAAEEEDHIAMLETELSHLESS